MIFFFFRGGGRGVVTAWWNKWGVRDRGCAPLGSPIIIKWSGQFMSCSLCQIYCTKHKIVVLTVLWYWEAQCGTWVVGSLCPSLEERQWPKISTHLVSVMGEHPSQSVASYYLLNNRCLYNVLLPGVSSQYSRTFYTIKIIFVLPLPK